MVRIKTLVHDLTFWKLVALRNLTVSNYVPARQAKKIFFSSKQILLEKRFHSPNAKLIKDISFKEVKLIEKLLLLVDFKNLNFWKSRTLKFHLTVTN